MSEKENQNGVETKKKPVRKESELRKRFRNDEVTDEERAQEWFRHK